MSHRVYDDTNSNYHAMNFEEFLEPRNKPNSSVTTAAAESASALAPELDVQKQVVEELAADKAALDDALANKSSELENLQKELAAVRSEADEAKRVLELAKIDISRLQGEVVRLREETAKAKDAASAEQANTARAQAELAAEKERQFDQQERNPNALALIDREVELPDRFPGETRDHVLEELRAARDRAEAEGRLRCAQVLEGVLVANEPNGTLAAKREELKKLFAENGNVVNGTVLEELKKLGLSHKNGDDYLLVDEIIKRAY